MRKVKQRRKNAILEALGAIIQVRRRDKKWSQEQLAAAAELHRTYITDVESGFRNLSLLTLARIAHALSCTLSQLLSEAEKETDSRNTIEISPLPT